MRHYSHQGSKMWICFCDFTLRIYKVPRQILVSPRAVILLSQDVVLLCFSVVIWLGDLNYRLFMYDAAEVKQHIARQELKRLQEVDQVRDAKLNYCLPTRTTSFVKANLQMKCFFSLVFHFHKFHFSASLNMPAAVFVVFVNVWQCWSTETHVFHKWLILNSELFCCSVFTHAC